MGGSNQLRRSLQAAAELGVPLSGRNVVVAVAGGIAAYKSVELVRLLSKAGARVRVAMTQTAAQFVGPLTFQVLSGQTVFTDLFDPAHEAEIGHIGVADAADLVIVAPATATTLARLCAGVASDPVSATVLATRAPVLLAPSMNVNMWNAPATRHNVATLTERGMRLVGPDDGFLACKWIGAGRLAEPGDIVEAASRLLTPQDLGGHHFVISAGATREALDPVRFLSNRSTGKMGYALARAAARRGAQVTLVSGPSALEPPLGVQLVNVETALQMQAAVHQAVKAADVVIMSAAVADFRPAKRASDKLKKAVLGPSPTVSLQKNPDILAELGAARAGRRPLLVGFAAETRLVAQAAREKRVQKRCDLMVANDVSASDGGFEVDTNRVQLFWEGGTEKLGLGSKDVIAHGILHRVRELLTRP